MTTNEDKVTNTLLELLHYNRDLGRYISTPGPSEIARRLKLANLIVEDEEVGTPKRTGFIYTIPLEYLHEGTHFQAGRTNKFGRKETIFGVAHMDGHAVSNKYGERAGNFYYTRKHPEANYINVRWDHITSYTDTYHHPNDGLLAKDKWTVWVTYEDYARFLEDKQYLARKEEEKFAEESRTQKRTELQKKLVEAQKSIVYLQKELENLK